MLKKILKIINFKSIKMATINPYLTFNGTCEAAFLFYQSVFGGEFPYIGKFKDMPADDNCPPPTAEDAERVMHVSLPIGKETILMGSDSTAQGGDVVFGGNFSISITTDSTEKQTNFLTDFQQVETLSWR